MELALGQKMKKKADIVSQNISDHPFITAALLCLAFFLLAMLLCDPRYEYNDDYGIDCVLSGTLTGKYDPHMPFSNILLGYILVGAYTLIPNVSFYFVLLEFLGLISVTVIVWIILKHCRPAIGILASVIFLVCFSDDLFILLQFTKTASATIAAGGFLFLEGIADKKLTHRKAMAVAGAMVFLTGAMLRHDCLYCVLPFLFVRFIVHVYKKPVKFLITRLLLCLMLIASSFALLGINEVIWNIEPEYKTFHELDKLRSPITDVPTPEYEVIQPELEELGLSEVDYYMAVTWGFTDMSVYPPETLSELAQILKDYNASQTNSFNHALSVFGNRNYWSYPGMLGIILIAVVLAFSDRKSLFPICGSFLACFGLLFYFAYINRMMYRVEFGVLFSAFAVLAVSLGNFPREIAVRKIFYYGSVIAVTCVMLIYHLSVYIPDTCYKTLDDKAYKERLDSVFGAAGYYLACYNTVVSERRPHEELLTMIENDDSHFYLLDVHAILDSNLDYNPWLRPDNSKAGQLSHSIGGWLMMQYPAETYAYELNGIDPVDPYKSLVNDNIFVIDNEYYGLKLAYLREHYYPDAQIALVGEASGCKIWKYFIPEQNGN